MTYKILTTKLNTHLKCIKYIEKRKWNNQPICPYCKSKKYSTKKKNNRYTCLSCNNSYSVTVGTVFESSKVPLNKWFFAIYLLSQASKSISSAQLARSLEVSNKTARYLRRKIQGSVESFLNSKDFVLVPKSNLSYASSIRSRKYDAKKIDFIQYGKHGYLKKLFQRTVFGTFHQMSDFFAQYYLYEMIIIYQYRYSERSFFKDLFKILYTKKLPLCKL